MQGVVHEKMKFEVPYTLIDDGDGVDGVHFDYTKLLIFLFKMFKLYGIAVTEGRVKISVTVDGADLSRNTQHVTAGIKILDPRAINPLTGIPLGFEGVQSQEFCFPVKILLAKDTKCLYKTHFTDFFEWAAKLNTVGVGPFKKCSVSSPQDISSFWKVLGRGGACKTSENFCHCCQQKSSNLITPNLLQYADCVRRGNNDCHHQPVCDKVYVNVFKRI